MNDIYENGAEHMLDFLVFLLMEATLLVLVQDYDLNLNVHGLFQKHYQLYTEQGL
jgi:hypothetical protein